MSIIHDGLYPEDVDALQIADEDFPLTGRIRPLP